MTDLCIRSLHVYPLKGARSIDVDRADVLIGGLRHDRRFLLVDSAGRFVTQREHPEMARVEVAVNEDDLPDGGHLAIAIEGVGRAQIPLFPTSTARRRVRIWDDDVDAIDIGGEGAALLSEHLRTSCSLVYMPPDTVRPVEQPYSRPGDRVGFADAYPVLVAAEASLDDLNRRLVADGHAPVGMDRFRPNIVVAGGKPYEEERAPALRVGSLRLRTPKKCARCQVVTVDQRTGATGKEPLRTLASYRSQRNANKVYFAMNAIPDVAPDASITIRVGEPVAYDVQNA